MMTNLKNTEVFVNLFKKLCEEKKIENFNGCKQGYIISSQMHSDYITAEEMLKAGQDIFVTFDKRVVNHIENLKNL
jgi:hypothetical protein